MKKIAIVFPGQGAQKIAMLQDFQEIAQTMAQELQNQGYPAIALLNLINHGSKEELDLTTNTQPALCFTKAVMIEALRRELNIEFYDFKNYVAITTGHSLGEYTALYFSGVITLLEMMNLVTIRAKLMQEAVQAGMGAMAAVLGLDDADVIRICQKTELQTNEVVSAVNFNCKGQVVIAGSKKGVEEAGIQLKQEFKTVKILPLPVSVPSHCALMESAFNELSEKINAMATSLNSPTIPVIQNTIADVAENKSQLTQELALQVKAPVLWTKSVQVMAEKYGITDIIELGPNKILTTLIKRCEYSANTDTKLFNLHNIYDMTTLHDVKYILQSA